MTVEEIRTKYIKDAGIKKTYSVIVRFEGVSRESVRAENPSEAEKLASARVVERSSGVFGNSKVVVKRTQAKEQ